VGAVAGAARVMVDAPVADATVTDAGDPAMVSPPPAASVQLIVFPVAAAGVRATAIGVGVVVIAVVAGTLFGVGTAVPVAVVVQVIACAVALVFFPVTV